MMEFVCGDDETPNIWIPIFPICYKPPTKFYIKTHARIEYICTQTQSRRFAQNGGTQKGNVANPPSGYDFE